jgi:ADP-heptose:LPS heptosyltransferase
MESENRILVILNRFIGDLLFMLPALRLIRDSYPDAHLEVLVNKDCEGILEPPLFDEAHVFDRTVRDLKGWDRTRRELRFISRFWGKRYELVVDLSIHSRNFWIVSMVRAPVKLAYGPIRRPWQRLAYTRIVPVFQGRYETERFLKVVEEGLGLDGRDYFARIDLPVSHAAIEQGRRYLKEIGVEGPFVLFAPFSRGRAKYRTWPFDKYAPVFEWVQQNAMTPLVLSGDEDGDWVQELREASGNSFQLVTNQTLTCVKGLMAQAETLVSIDTGIIHLAASVGLRGVGLWGPTTCGTKVPVACHIHLGKDYECRAGCGRGGWGRCAHKKCLADITPQEVITAMASLLPKTARGE